MELGYTLSIRLEHGGKRFFGPGPARLLRLVQQQHSLHKAAALMGMAYSKAWRIINEIDAAMGEPVLHRSRGGSAGGGSSLTEAGEALLEAYEAFVSRAREEVDRCFAACFQADGEE